MIIVISLEIMSEIVKKKMATLRQKILTIEIGQLVIKFQNFLRIDNRCKMRNNQIKVKNRANLIKIQMKMNLRQISIMLRRIKKIFNSLNRNLVKKYLKKKS